MSNVVVKNNRYTVDPLYQWDLNQELVIYGLSLASIPEIHFTNTGMDRAIVKQATMDDAGVIRADVPNSLLQKPYKITAYVCIYEGETFKSLYAIEIPVKPRSKPGDYTLENDEEVYSFNALENLINNTMVSLIAKYDETIEVVNKTAKTTIDNISDKNEKAINDLTAKCDETVNTVDNIKKDAIEAINRKIDLASTSKKTLSDSYSGGLRINNIAGAVEQKQYSGKNLIPYPYHQAFPRVNRGITFDDNGDGGILCNGVSDTANQPYFMCELNTVLLKANQAYTFSSNCANENGFAIIYFRDGSSNTTITYTEIRNGVQTTVTSNYISEFKGEVTNGVTIIPSQDVYMQFDVRFKNNGATIENAVFYPQLELGTERTEWEKYVGGTTSPNPDYPQEIQNVDFTEIKTVGMNLIPFPYYRGETYAHRGITYNVDENGVITLNGTATDISWCALIANEDFIPLEEGETYTIWCNRINNNGSTLFFRHYYMDSDGNITSGNHTNALRWRVTGSESIKKLGVAVGVYNAGETCNNAKIEIMVVKGEYESEDLSYYPPKYSSTASISFVGRAVKVSADDDYTYEKDEKYYVADTIERVDGGYKKVQRIGETVFDGVNNKCNWIGTIVGKDETLTQINMGANSFWKENYTIPSNSDQFVCDKFIPITNYTGQNVTRYTARRSLSNGVLCCHIPSDLNITTIDEANTWLQSNPITVHAELLTPIITYLSDEEVTSLLSLKTFDNVTHIFTDSKIQPIINVAYGANEVGALAIKSDNDNNITSKKPYGMLSTDNVNYYVDGINGSDNNPGTKAKPFKTFDRFLKEYFKFAEIRCIFIGDCDEYTMDTIETFNGISMHLGNESNSDNITIHFNGVHTPAFYNCHLNVGGTADKYFTLDIPNDLYFDGGSWTMGYAHITNGMLGMNGGYAICNYNTFDNARLRIGGGTGYVRGCKFNGINHSCITCTNGGNLYVRTSLTSDSIIEDLDNNGVYAVIVGYGARIMLGCVLTTGDNFSGRGLYLQESAVLCNDSRFATWNINNSHLSSSVLLGNTYQFLHNT